MFTRFKSHWYDGVYFSQIEISTASSQKNLWNFEDRGLKFDMLVLCGILKRNSDGIFEFPSGCWEINFFSKKFWNFKKSWKKNFWKLISQQPDRNLKIPTLFLLRIPQRTSISNLSTLSSNLTKLFWLEAKKSLFWENRLRSCSAPCI